MQDDVGLLATGLADRRCEQVVADEVPEVGLSDVALHDVAGGDLGAWVVEAGQDEASIGS